MDCPKCNGVSVQLTPFEKFNKGIPLVHACQSCGHTFSNDGTPYVKNVKQMRDIFHAATRANSTLEELFGGKTLDPQTKAVLVARLVEYGSQCWFDGLQQGIVLQSIHVIKDQEKHNGKVRSEEGYSAPGPKGTGGQVDAKVTEGII